uniref:Origin recognition complex subunit 5 C-terminal domain-containing protein n=1 Tax=Entomoneis paludosa TaxID=265537 RepID=A0A7S2YES3_9STRA|mmetsp:Transcript_29503/g.61662  ORF Transcript_29503/g.61662 Transcript_29503/m.61662 type:complete len:305 (+) Transcript_29503:348-1262(+)|eukprot:CAMPEP_0172449634 /NCGR_PEP_ID=MMETSP1065-20121228/8285_1 /TAXON_ID=265537 /ORGANISM="Amphiprora paludosa, Strain CCMP125" /LENGTH=304 /DNA_ID=CAMNT_0013201345 /DNA_START=354 /DNA_END=1268 /DNA_ORIENTATION=-
MVTGRVQVPNNSDIGAASKAAFQWKVYQSFVHLFINTIYDSIKDMNEIIRMARLLWPIYGQPLLPENIEQTFQNTFASKEKEPPRDPECSALDDALVLEYLDRKALSQFRRVRDSCLSILAPPPPPKLHGKHAAKVQHFLNEAISRPARYLLLAAYLCQVNRPEQDRSLFSIQKNGRQRKKALNEENTTAMGGGSKAGTSAATIRLRSFPLERLLSIYVSLVGLHGTSQEDSNGAKWNALALSNLQDRVGEWLVLLISMGVLQSSSLSSDVIRLSEPRYSCHATAYEAHIVADSLGFPLDRYLL